MGSRVARLRDPVTLAVGALAVHRLTKLLVDDEITATARGRIAAWAEGDAYREAHPKVAYLLTCPWCVSMYVGAAWAALAVTAPEAAVLAGAALAWSSVTGLLASLE